MVRKSMGRGVRSLLVSVAALGLIVSGASLATAMEGAPGTVFEPYTISGYAYESDGTTPAVGLTVTAASSPDRHGSWREFYAQVRSDGSYSISVGLFAGAFTVRVGDYSGGSGDVSSAAVSAGSGATSVTAGRKEPTCTIAVSRTPGVNSTVTCTAYQEFNAPLADDSLTDDMRRGVTMDKDSTLVDSGPTVTLQLPTSYAEAQVYLFVYSDPRALTAGAVRTNAAARVSTVLPKDLTVGLHKVAAYDYYGNLIGWAPIEVKAAATTPATTVSTTTAATRSGSLPQTGSDATMPLLFGAGGLILAGGALFLANKRRHRSSVS